MIVDRICSVSMMIRVMATGVMMVNGKTTRGMKTDGVATCGMLIDRKGYV